VFFIENIYQEKLDSGSSQIKTPEMDFPKLCQAPPEVVTVVVLLVRAGVKEVNVAAEINSN
jgi:hypothetical protein